MVTFHGNGTYNNWSLLHLSEAQIIYLALRWQVEFISIKNKLTKLYIHFEIGYVFCGYSVYR